MSSTNKTANYKLSQFIGTDKPTFLGDYNNDMEIIDGAIFEAYQSAEQALNDVESVKGAQAELKNVHTETQEQVAQLKETADGMSNNVATAQETANSAEQKATEAQTAATGVVNAANAASVNATRAKQTADGNAETLTQLEERLANLESTPRLDDIRLQMEMGGWKPNIASGAVSDKTIIDAGGRNTVEFNVTAYQMSGGALYFIDGTENSNKQKITKTGLTTFTLTNTQFSVLFEQSAQSGAEVSFALTVSKK